MADRLAMASAPARMLRVDLTRPDGPGRPIGWLMAVAALAVGFVLVGGGSLDLGPIESRLGMAAGEGLGPFGQVYGGWEPGLWPGQVVPSRLWALAEGEGGTPSRASVRWPSAIAGVVIGLLLAGRLGDRLGPRAGVLMGLCWFGSLALIDRSAGAGIDLMAGLGTIGALDRILARGSDLVAGFWAGLAFLAGGWPPLAVLALATVVIGRPGSTLSLRLVVPALVVALAWSAWALAVAPAQAWGAALALPLMQPPAWTLALGIVVLGLPWSPFAALAASRTVRESWPAPGRALVLGWLQVAGACALAGTLIPGLASAARMPALAGLAVAAAASCDRAWAGALPAAARRWALGSALAVVLAWATLATLQGGYLALAVSYYRPVALVLVVLALTMAPFILVATRRGDARWAIGAVVAVAVCLKVAHWGVYVPEWNYRKGQGPWGRAIGQWVPPRWPIYTLHTWPADLAFATEHPIRQLVHPRLLKEEAGPRPAFILLQASEFEHWPDDAPRLLEVRSFRDERDGRRVLARTEGDLADARFRRPEPD